MRYLLTIAICALIGGCVEAEAATVTVTDEVILDDAMRIGINLGGPNDYGAENWLRNMVPNPGMEPGVWGSVVSTRGGTATERIQQDYWDTRWHNATIGQDAGFWTGARWELPAQGLSGTVLKHTYEPVLGTDGQPIPKRDAAGKIVYDAAGKPVPAVVAHTYYLDRQVTAAWHEPLLVRTAEQPNGNPARPGSSGVQSRLLKSPGNTYQTINNLDLDTLSVQGQVGDNGGGALRLLRGPHEARFWARGPGEVALCITRGAVVILEKRFTLTDQWAEYSTAFTPNESEIPGKAPALRIGWKVLKGTQFYLDDLYVGQAGPGVFADELVAAVKTLNPGVIRGWQGFHGDTLKNLLGDQYARGPREYRPRGKRATAYGYGIPDLLELCQQTDALPWIVLPPTLTDAEMGELGGWLRASAADFARVWVEFANEAWGSNNPGGGDPFAGASFDGGEFLGAAAHRKFTAMGDVQNVTKVIGGQAAWAGQNEAIRKASGAEYMIPTAPYYGVLKELYATPEDMLYPLYARAYEDVSVQGRPAANREAFGVYELNFHTTGGAGGNKAVVNSFVASQAGGLSIPLYALGYARAFGWQPTCVFALSQYTTGGVRMWGVYRDIMATGRMRGTGWALALANRAIMGNMVKVDVAGVTMIDVAAGNGLTYAQRIPALEAFGWREGREWSCLLLNLSMTDVVPVEELQPTEAQILMATDPLATNEDAQVFEIEPHEWAGSVPPHSAIVLRGTDPEPPADYTVDVPAGTARIILVMPPK